MEDREPQLSIGTSLVVFLLGVAVGATAAILYAPASGDETRRNLSDKASELKDKAADLSHQVKDKAADLSHQVKDKAADLTHQVAERAGELREKVASRIRPLSENGDMPMPIEATADGAQG